MADKSAFDRQHVEQSALVETSGLLEQLNLPPAAIAFIRKNQRAIWIAVAAVVILMTGIALYGSWREYRLEKAASALDAALLLDENQRLSALEEVVARYGSTPSGTWARIEIAHLVTDKGDLDRAVAELVEVNGKVGSSNPLKPLLLYNIGALYEKQGQLEKALASYQPLGGFKGFEVESYRALGRIYELQGNTAGAREMYEKFLAARKEQGDSVGADPETEIIQYRLGRLQ
ncbi:YfgM family protein [Desulfolithobacter sp.]